MSEYGPDIEEHNDYNEYESFAFHPYNVMMALVLFGLTTLFLSLSVAFIYSRVQSDLPPIKLPDIFIFNTLILLGSSYTMIRAKKAYKEDNTARYKQLLLVTIILSILFLIAQIFGWRALFQQDILINSGNSASYLYVISALHFGHVIFGIPFLGTFLWRAHKYMKEPVSVLVYFSDPAKLLRLRLLTIYWHFLDGLWIYLVLFFWINHLIR
ncbi:cytochrome c oxidase subunit 3 [Flavilitoribacter nigricans]|uniref:Cytochrome c oxidase subunit III n=1 Tax=Flavilitoribacter nigricans (strain ATCC 23147 / DSM 23189 / NBRC 102662 / NCIMB 1420 / SS-2) TaxID=1122177 RepID=A0A2D0NDN5_FLAN2|nr:cytochrome c oxidase subunit 3 [Flavilitoribacter nigricans]PHN06595.1 cytochrome c oxidase subunit III [Flavilitoribacter nigricans DSM 23189 = NBRC 102662]